MIARSRLLVLRVLYEKQDSQRYDYRSLADAQSTLISHAKKSTALLQFDYGKVSKGVSLIQETLRQNRLR